MKSPNIFRTATPHDINNIVELVHSAYRGESSRAGWTTEAEFLDGTRTDSEEVNTLINTPDNLILLCEQHQQLAASVHLQKQNNLCYLGMFAVHQNKQKAGIGKALLIAAEQYARTIWHCSHMQMTVITLRTELINWYERRGYQRTGQFKPFPYGIKRYGDPKRDDLMLEILAKKLS